MLKEVDTPHKYGFNPDKRLKLGDLTILIVDDVKSMRSIVRKMLRRLKIGKVMLDAENGLEGLRILQKNPVDMAIIDLKMPVMNGSQLLEKIREDKRLRDMIVIMVTAESQRDMVIDAAETVVDAYLLKPLTPATLEERIKAAVDSVNNPDEATQYIRQARDMEEKGEYASAIRYLQLALKTKPGASRLLRNIGRLFQKAGDYGNAQKFLEKAVSVNRQDIISRKLMAELYWEKKNYKAAARGWAEIVRKTRRFNGEAITIGGKLMALQQTSLAIDIFNQIFAKVEKDLPLKTGMVDMCIQNRELAYARQLLRLLIREFPGSLDLVYKAGVVAEAMDDADGALEHFTQLEAKQQVTPVDVLMKIAKLYIRRDKVIQADDYLNKILRREPDNKEAMALRQNL